ncbi:MAG: hypothetical protein WA918_03940 [Erythrobacter sp.]
MSNHATAIFDTRAEAERAIADLRQSGISDDAISIVANRDQLDQGDVDGHHVEDSGDAAKDVAGKTALGAGVGALLGVAALAIPGVGPLVAAGSIAQIAIGGAATTGTVVGAAAGGIAGVLTDHGVEKDHVGYYEDHIEKGGILISVDRDHAGAHGERAEEILYRHGGHSPTRQRVS